MPAWSSDSFNSRCQLEREVFMCFRPSEEPFFKCWLVTSVQKLAVKTGSTDLSGSLGTGDLFWVGQLVAEHLATVSLSAPSHFSFFLGCGGRAVLEAAERNVKILGLYQL